MVNKKRFAIILTLIFVLSVIVVSGCKRKLFNHPERIKALVSWHVDDLLDDINATETQREKINIIKDRVLVKFAKKHKENKKFMLDSLSLWEGEDVDMNLVNERIDSKLAERKEAIHLLAGELKEIHDILSPEQRTRIISDLRERLTD